MDGTTSRLLLLDGNELNLFLLTDLVQELGATAIVAESGKQALELCGDHSFSAIVTAMDLPDMSAYQLLNRLQADAKTADIPVVFLLPSLGHRDNSYSESNLCPVEVVHLPINKLHFQGKLSLLLKQDQRFKAVRHLFQQEFQSTDQSNSGYLLVNEQGEIIHASSVAVALLRSRLSQLIGLYFETLLARPNIEAISSWRKTVLFQSCKNNKTTTSEEVTVYRGDGSEILVQLVAHPLHSRPEGFAEAHSLIVISPEESVTPHRSISEFSAAVSTGLLSTNPHHELAGIDIDQLTGLETLSGLTEALTVALMGDHADVTVMLINLDHFDYLNESLGQENGDRLLKAVAQRLANCMPLQAKLARLQGDEFALLLPPQKDSHDVLRVAHALRVIFSSSFLVAGNEVYTSASFGVACAPEAGTIAPQLLRNAARALKKAKQNGAGAIELYSADAVLSNLSNMERQSELRCAIPAQRFQLRFREMKGMTNGELVGQIAELYWQTEDQGLQELDSFRELAEHVGLMPEIGIWLLENACSEYMSRRKEWKPGCRLIVDIPLSLLLDKRFLPSLESVLSKHQFPASLLQLQLHEAELNRNYLKDIVAVIRDLDRPEMRIAIDDFGSNFLALLQYLCDTALPEESVIDLDCLTLGTEFSNTLATLTGNSSAEFMLSGVLDIARQYGLDIAIDNASESSPVYQLMSDAIATGWNNTVYFSEPCR